MRVLSVNPVCIGATVDHVTLSSHKSGRNNVGAHGTCLEGTSFQIMVAHACNRYLDATFCGGERWEL